MSRLNPRAWYRKPSGGIPAADLDAVVARTLGVYTAAESGYAGWSIDPGLITTASAVAQGTLFFTRIKLVVAGPISNVLVPITTQGTSLTNSWVAIYAMDGTQLGVSADQTTSWNTNGGKVVSLITPTASQPVGTTVLAAMLSIGTTGPSIRAGAAVASVNQGLSAATVWRWGSLGSQSSMPSPLPLASTASLTTPLFLAVA